MKDAFGVSVHMEKKEKAYTRGSVIYLGMVFEGLLEVKRSNTNQAFTSRNGRRRRDCWAHWRFSCAAPMCCPMHGGARRRITSLGAFGATGVGCCATGARRTSHSVLVCRCGRYCGMCKRSQRSAAWFCAAAPFLVTPVVCCSSDVLGLISSNINARARHCVVGRGIPENGGDAERSLLCATCRHGHGAPWQPPKVRHCKEGIPYLLNRLFSLSRLPGTPT